MKNIACFLFLIWFYLPVVAQNSDNAIKKQVDLADKLNDNELTYKKLDSLNKLKTISPKAQVIVKLSLAKTAVKLQKYGEAANLSYQGIELAKKTGLDTAHVFFYMVLGGVNYYLLKFPESIIYFKKAATIAEQKNILNVQVNAFQNLGAVYTDSKKLDTGEYYLKKAIKLSAECGASCARYRFMAFRLLATLYQRQKKYDQSVHIFQQLEKETLSVNDTTLASSLLIHHAQVLILTGNNQKALQKFRKAVTLLRQYKSRTDDSFIWALQNLSKELNRLSQYKEALALSYEVNDLQKIRFKADNQQQTNELEAKFKLKEIEQQKQLAEANSKAQQQQKKLLLVILLVTVLCFLLALTVIYFRNKKKKTEEKIQQQKLLVETILNTEEKERSRIATDLHDGIVQDLTAIKLALNAITPQAPINLQSQIKNIFTEINNTAKEVREIAYQMMPIGLKELGIAQALTELLNRSFNSTTTSFEFNTFGINQRLTEKIELTIYRICQELIQNTIKHSGANHVSVLIQIRNNTLQLTYEDNGAGFNNSSSKKGIGLNSIDSRIETVKGSFEIESNTNTGTTAFIRIPL